MKPVAVLPVSLAAPVNTIDLAFVFRGEVEVCEDVDTSMKVSKLRDIIAEILETSFDVKPNKYRLLFETLRRPDGSWPSEDDAITAKGNYIKFTNCVSTEFKGAGAEDEIHFRVMIRGEEEAIEPPAEDTEEPDIEYSDVDDLRDTFNSGCGYMRFSGRKRIAQKIMPFSDMNEENVKRIFRRDTIEEFNQPSMKLPPKLEQSIRESYANLVLSRRAPWGQNEAQKRAFIASILDSCIVTVNSKNPTKENLRLQAEYPTQCVELQASSSADWVVTRGNHMLVVMEAKKSDIQKGEHQLLAMMEALRYNTTNAHPLIG